MYVPQKEARRRLWTLGWRPRHCRGALGQQLPTTYRQRALECQKLDLQNLLTEWIERSWVQIPPPTKDFFRFFRSHQTYPRWFGPKEDARRPHSKNPLCSSIGNAYLWQNNSCMYLGFSVIVCMIQCLFMWQMYIIV